MGLLGNNYNACLFENLIYNRQKIIIICSVFFFYIDNGIKQKFLNSLASWFNNRETRFVWVITDEPLPNESFISIVFILTIRNQANERSLTNRRLNFSACLRCPVLYIAGTKDCVCIPKGYCSQTEHINDLESTELDSSHWIMEERPEEVNQTI